MMKVTSSHVRLVLLAVAAATALHPQATLADESGVSLWLPGQFGSLAAAPAVPGWSVGAVDYHTSVEASGNVAAARQIQIGQVPATANINLNATVKADGDLLFIAPTYTFASPVLGGQLAVGVTGIVGNLYTNLSGTLTAQLGPIVGTPARISVRLGDGHWRPLPNDHTEVESGGA